MQPRRLPAVVRPEVIPVATPVVVRRHCYSTTQKKILEKYFPNDFF